MTTTERSELDKITELKDGHILEPRLDRFTDDLVYDSDDHFQLSQAPTRCHPLSLRPVTSSINSFRYSFFVNSPFLWNTIPHTILRIKQPPLFRLALRRFLF